MASALAINSTARTVSRPGSPGPAPTKNTPPTSAIRGSAHLARRADRTVRRLPDQPLDHDRVLPLPVEPPMPAVNAYLAEAARPGEREAGRVLGEDPAQELVVAAPLGLGREAPPGRARRAAHATP